MDPIKPFDDNMILLGKVLDLRAKKAEVISSNIANAETPGFTPSRFEFEKDLTHALTQTNKSELQTTHPSHIGVGPTNFNSVNGKVVEEAKTTLGDKNSVSLDQEMLALSENELLYETSAQLLKKKLTLLKHVISGGQ